MSTNSDSAEWLIASRANAIVCASLKSRVSDRPVCCDAHCEMFASRSCPDLRMVPYQRRTYSPALKYAPNAPRCFAAKFERSLLFLNFNESSFVSIAWPTSFDFPLYFQRRKLESELVAELDDLNLTSMSCYWNSSPSSSSFSSCACSKNV
jgi:hypothetical protein